LFSDQRLFLFFSILDLLLSTNRFFSFCFPFSVSGGRLYDQEGRRLLGFCRVWPTEMEKRSAIARGHWSCCGDGRGCWRCGGGGMDRSVGIGVAVGTVVGSVGAVMCWLLEMGDGATAADGEDRGSVSGWNREDLSAAGWKVVLPVEGWRWEESGWKGEGRVCGQLKADRSLLWGGCNKEGNAGAGAREGQLVHAGEVFFSKGGSGGLEKMSWKGGGAPSLKEMGFRVRVFFLYFF